MSKIVNAINDDISRISSREVTEMMEVSRHSDILAKIDNLNKILLNGKVRSADYWIESTYKDSTGRDLREYLVSKKGCELIAHKSTGEKGVMFTVKYMERFNEMEQKLKSPYLGMSKELQAIFTIDQKQQEIEIKVDKLYNTMTIDYSQQEELRITANIRAINILGGKGSVAYKKVKHRVFQDLWRSYKRKFKVNSYKNTAIKDYEDGVNFIENWEPDEVILYAIQGLNNQYAFA